IVNHVPFYEYYPGWGARTVVIDGSGQLNHTLEKSNHILDLAKIANEYGSDVLPFESVTLGKGWASDPATIDVGNRKITIVTKELHLKDSIELLSEEDGYLEIVVIGQKNGTLVAGDFTSDLLNVQAPKSSNLRFIVYESETEITLNTKGGHGNTFVGTVFSENLNLNAATAYSGNFISANGKSIVIDNVGASLDSQLIYAPMAHLTLGGGTLKGVIVVGSYTPGNTGTSFIFDPLTAQNLIDEIDHPLFDFGEGSEGGIEIDGSLDFYDVIQEVDE
ncbi:MAG TPA: hypothetical protein VFC75_02755, partial [Erysipelothrix sp.]|nr:hypothetical protein [Erysipelothrix sp.]